MGRPQPPSRARTQSLLILTAILTLLLSACTGTNPSNTAVSDGGVIQEIEPQERKILETFAGETLEDGPFDLADHQGEVLLINVWGSWCVPCRTEAPELARAALEFDEVQFVGINVRDNDASAIAFERSFDITYPSLTTDASGPAMLSVGRMVPRSAVPTTIIVGRDGRVTARIVGPGSFSTFSALLTAALDEKGQPNPGQ
ncbi:TlpA disulfide reductase family protein [Nocardioides salsibiostraticola]